MAKKCRTSLISVDPTVGRILQKKISIETRTKCWKTNVSTNITRQNYLLGSARSKHLVSKIVHRAEIVPWICSEGPYTMFGNMCGGQVVSVVLVHEEKIHFYMRGQEVAFKILGGNTKTTTKSHAEEVRFIAETFDYVGFHQSIVGPGGKV